MTNEPWFAHIPGVNYLRVSAGFDVSGNDDINYHAARSYFSSTNFLEDVSALSFENIGNTELQWETTKRLNAGLEANLLSNRLNVRFNYFHSTTGNLLMYQPLRYVTGLERNWTNGGELRNQGFDVKAVAKVLALKDFQWELGASVGHYKNKITELVNNQSRLDPVTVYGASILTEVGQPANLFYGFKTMGVFSTSEEAAAANLRMVGENGESTYSFKAGDMHFYDPNGDGIISDGSDGYADDRVVIGDPNPDIYGNIFTSLAYKRLKLDINLNYSLGNDVYNYMRQQLESGSRFMNQTTAMTRRWQTEGQHTDVHSKTPWATVASATAG